jgi:glucose-1-phosphatase
MPTKKPKAIIFDIGRVLIQLDVARAMSALAEGLPLSPTEVWTAIQKDPRWADWQEGRISPHDWHLHLGKRLGASLTFERFAEVWSLALAPEPIQDDAFLAKLSKRYRLALLSNTDAIHVPHMESAYSFFRFFPARIYSNVLGVSKPNPLIYREALQAVKAKPEEAVYIDDIPEYAEAARKLGMSGVVFKEPEQLKNDLRAVGVDVD